MKWLRSLHGSARDASNSGKNTVGRIFVSDSATDTDEGQIHAEAAAPLFFITIDRPAKRNGFTPRMLTQLAEAYTAYEAAEDCHCAVVRAEGDHFTGGLDLPKVAPFIAAGNSLFPPGTIDPFDMRSPRRAKPVVVAVKGCCLTLGIELMLAADIVVAADDTKFSQLEVQRNLMASGGATIRMAERAGMGNAMRYLLTGDFFDATEALRLNFVQEVVPAGTELDRAIALAETVAAQAPLAVRATLANARLASEQGPEAAIAQFKDTQAKLMESEDSEEGLRAFEERRPGRFKGR
jgi:enoyl-CoA hydratase/carnithine racemase